MGAYNLVRDLAAACPRGRVASRTDVQFKFGKLWQHRCAIGERVTWGTHNEGLYLERDARRAASRWFARAASMGHARSREFLVTRDSKLLLERRRRLGEPGRRR